MATIYLLNKPYQVLCQFRDNENRTTLADYITTPNVYAAGRLDYDSEGLLLLTADGQLQHSITQPKLKQPKSYWVQVEGQITNDALNKLRQGVRLKDGPTQPANAEVIPEPPIWPRHPPIRERANIPTSWINLTITEGRNRQVRRMTAAVGFPTLRLIRHQIAGWKLKALQPGQWRQEEAAAPSHTSQTRTAKSSRNANRKNINKASRKPNFKAHKVRPR